MGCVSPGGVHAMQGHIAATANVVASHGVPVVVHAFTDGRDVPPRDAKTTMPDFVGALNAGITVGTVTGRYWAMDRDNRWERVGTALDVIVQGTGSTDSARCDCPVEAIAQSYAIDVGDEFVAPTAIGDYGGMQDGDGILMCNFRGKM